MTNITENIEDNKNWEESVRELFKENWLYADCTLLMGNVYWSALLAFDTSVDGWERIHETVIDFLIDHKFTIHTLTYEDFLYVIETEPPPSSNLINNNSGWHFVDMNYADNFFNSILRSIRISKKPLLLK